MPRVADQIEHLLIAAFAPTALAIIDDSVKHAGHAGARPQGESHFTVRLTSAAFDGKTHVERHRMVYAVLQPLLDEGLHALAIEANA